MKVSFLNSFFDNRKTMNKEKTIFSLVASLDIIHNNYLHLTPESSKHCLKVRKKKY